MARRSLVSWAVAVCVRGFSLASLAIAEADLGLPWNWRIGPASKPVSDETYVAQAFAAPSARIVHGGRSLKVDVRCFASAAGVVLFAARLYQGQTTNMRTPSGGFAAVLTTPVTDA